MTVHVVDRHLRGLRDADLCRKRADLLVREPVELLAALPDVDNANAVVRLGHPVEERAGRSVAARSQPHLVENLVVLVERCALEIHDHCNGHFWFSLWWLDQRNISRPLGGRGELTAHPPTRA